MSCAKRFSWRVIFCASLLLLCFAASAFAAGDSYVLEDGKVFRVDSAGQRKQIETVDVMASALGDGKGISWFAVDPNVNEEEMAGSESGVYFFDYKDDLLFFMPFEDAGIIGNIFFSPDGKQMVMDTGTWVVRDFMLYNFKETKEKISLTGMGDPIWIDAHRFAFTYVEPDAEPRPSETDFDGWLSIVVYDTAINEMVPVMKATETQNYYLDDADIEKGELNITETSVKAKADWADMDKQEDKEISVPFPAAG